MVRLDACLLLEGSGLDTTATIGRRQWDVAEESCAAVVLEELTVATDTRFAAVEKW